MNDRNLSFYVCRDETSPFEAPKADTTIWRYMDLCKFIHLLHSKTLHLTRLDRFDDKWEGAYPRPEIDYLESFAVCDSPLEKKSTKYNQELMRRSVFVVCWHMNEYESSAMWKLYGDGSLSVALKTSVERLRNSLPDEKNKKGAQALIIGAVKYINYDKDSFGRAMPNGYDMAFHKRRSFEHERELRLMVMLLDEQGLESARHTLDASQCNVEKHGIDVPVELSTLIDDVYLSPDAAQWQVDVVHSLLTCYGINAISPKKSSLDEATIL